MLRYGLAYKNREDRRKVASNAAKARWANYQGQEDYHEPIILPDPLYTLTFSDHIIGKDYIFTLHKGKKANSFRIDVNGQPFRNGGWSKVLEEIRKKRVRIERMRGGSNGIGNKAA